MTEKHASDPLDKVTRDSARILAFTSFVLSILLVVFIAAGTIIITHAFGQLHSDDTRAQRQTEVITREEASLCDFFNVIATVPVITTGSHKSTRILVRWIIDSRNTYTARSCVPPLPDPSHDLLQLAVEYNLKPPRGLDR